MIKMVKAKATSSGAEWDLRLEFYEKYKEDFQIIKEFEIEDEAERIASAAKAVPVEEEEEAPKAPTKKPDIIITAKKPNIVFTGG